MDTPQSKRMNQFGDYEDVTNMSVEDWEYRWGLQQTGFHMKAVHPMLQKHCRRLTAGKKNARVFLPLCGKSLDLKWLLEQGHEVVGNEAVDDGCKQFFEEQKIPYEIKTLDGIDGAVYVATDGRPISIYRCDFFDLSPALCGRFDAVWDRGSLVAIPIVQRPLYASLMKSMMKKDCVYLLDAFIVNNEIFAGPPFNCKETDVTNLFLDCCNVNHVDTRNAFGKWQESWGLSEFIENVYEIRLK